MKFDVTVIGAGPAGSAAAQSLAKKGFKTVLFEKKDFSKSKVCGGLLPAGVLREFDIPRQVLLRDILGYEVYLPKNEIIVFNFNERGATTNRNLLDSFLAKKALNSGAEVVNAKVKNVKIEKEKVSVFIEKNSHILEVDSEIVIAADGVSSQTVKRIMGNIYRSRNLALGYQVNFPLIQDLKYFDVFISETIGYGLGWLSPKLETATLGIGVDLRRGRVVKNIFYDHLKERENILSEKISLDKGSNEEIAVLPVDRFLSKAYSNRFLIVGDAALLVNPFSGDGIYYALKSGKIAADVVEKAFEKGCYSEECLKEYQSLLEAEFGEIFDLCIKIHRFYKHPKTLSFIMKDPKKMYEFLNNYIWSKTRKDVPLAQKLAVEFAYIGSLFMRF